MGRFAHIDNSPEAIRGADTVPTHQPGLAPLAAITIAFLRATRAIDRAVVVVAWRRRIRRGRTIDDAANSCGVPQIRPLFRRVRHVGLIPEDNVLSVHIFAAPIGELTPDSRAPTDVFDYMTAASEDEVVILLLRDNGSCHVPAIIIKKYIHTEFSRLGLPACTGIRPNMIIPATVQVEV